MIDRFLNKHVQTLIIMGTILLLSITSLLFGLVWPPMVTQAGPTLPARDDPTTNSDDDGDDEDDDPVGAYIELYTQGGNNNLWNVVQWQDSDGQWHPVTGWQGSVDNGYRRWWVAPKDFGTGPFRWIITQGPKGPTLGISRSFTLPTTAHQIIQVRVSIKL